MGIDKFLQPVDGIEVIHSGTGTSLISPDVYERAAKRIAAGEDRETVVTELAMEIVEIEDGLREDGLLPEVEVPRALGDLPGHEFHGNQWTGGIGDFASGAEGERPWSWDVNKDRTSVPHARHKVVKTDRGAWGYSHGNSKAFTGKSADLMGIEGYHQTADVEETVPMAFLEAIASDQEGSEEPLYHSFENVRGVIFKEGDTFRLPMTATAGDIGHYGIRSDRDDQKGEPVVIKFEQGTQMAGYSTMTLRSAKEDLGHETIQDALNERRYLWDEAIVAGGFKVVSVKERVPLGLQHWNSKHDHGTAYGKVVTVKQVETFDPAAGKWRARG
jgi:hypothetical protein